VKVENNKTFRQTIENHAIVIVIVIGIESASGSHPRCSSFETPPTNRLAPSAHGASFHDASQMDHVRIVRRIPQQRCGDRHATEEFPEEEPLFSREAGVDERQQ
jgi:hypothetical protein